MFLNELSQWWCWCLQGPVHHLPCSWHCPQGYQPSYCPLRLSLSIPCRYHNSTLLDPSLYKHESKLVLRNLQRDQAGEYFCKAQSDAGAAKSHVARLTVIGKTVRAPGEPLLQHWGAPQWAFLGSKTLGFSGLCTVLCSLGHKDGTDLDPTLTELPLQDGWRNKRQVSKDGKNVVKTGDKELWTL